MIPEGWFFEVFKTQGSTTQPWRFRCKSGNGEIVFSTSEGYYSKWNVKRAIQKIAGKDASIRYV